MHLRRRLRLKLMCDHDAFPVWRLKPRGQMIRPEELPITSELGRDLARWSEDWIVVVAKNELAGNYPRPESEAAHWDAWGRSLLDRLRTELGKSYVVGYWNEWLEVVEWPGDRSQ